MPSWVVNRGNPPDRSIDFTNNRAWKKAGGLSTAASLLTVSRASSGYVNDNLGNWTNVLSNLPRISNLGLLVEESRTNSIRNSSMQGAVAGSPGTLPTNWSVASPTGLTRTLTTTAFNGVSYLGINLQGTTTNSTAITIQNEAANSIAASQGQTFSASSFLIVQQTDPNVTQVINRLQGTNGASQTEAFDTNVIGSLSSSQWFRAVSSGTFLLSTTTNSRQVITTNTIGNGVPINYTIWIGWPQLENNTLINSTVASAVTAASGASGVNGSAVYSVGGGTGTTATLNVTWAAGVMTVNSVASAGSYTVFPPSPAALTYVSGVATGWTGATVTLTPTNNAAQAFATSPIVTSGAAATRAADVVTLTSPPTFGSAYTLYAKGTPQAPVAYSLTQNILSIDDNSAVNRTQLSRNPTTATANYFVQGGGSAAGAVWALSTSGKLAAAFAVSDQAASFNGGGIFSSASATMTSPITTTHIGTNGASSGHWDGFVQEIGIWASQRVPNAQLQSMTT